jgi:uncharacterized protein YjbI with pentapeptide repeats
MKFEIKNRFSGEVMFKIEGDSFKLAFSAAVKSGQAFKEADLSNQDFSGLILDCINSRFDNSSFDNSSFDNSSFDNSSFDNSRFDNSSFDNSRFDNSRFDNSRFDNSSFYNSSFDNSSFDNSRFDNSSFYNSSFYNSSFYNSRFDNSSFDNSSFYNSRFDNSSFDNSRFDNSSFYNSSFDNSSFDNSRFDNSSFDNSSFDNSRFDNSSFYNSRFDNSSFDNSRFDGIPEQWKIQCRDDIWAVLSAAPSEVEGLRKALAEGRVNGSAYEGECACLVGTIANVRGCHYEKLEILKPNSRRAAECWFLSIKEGDKPENNPFSKLALEWIDDWLARMQAAFAGAK